MEAQVPFLIILPHHHFANYIQCDHSEHFVRRRSIKPLAISANVVKVEVISGMAIKVLARLHLRPQKQERGTHGQQQTRDQTEDKRQKTENLT